MMNIGSYTESWYLIRNDYAMQSHMSTNLFTFEEVSYKVIVCLWANG